MRFRNRTAAGQALAAGLEAYRGGDDVLVLALPRGGVEVGFAVARVLGAELDVCLVRKLGVPGQEELAMGAIASDGTLVLNDSVIGRLGVSEAAIASVVACERRELERREGIYGAGRGAAAVRGRTVILTDDGLATGATMRAAARAVAARAPARLILAVPVAPAGAREALAGLADEIVVLRDLQGAVGAAYDDFSQTSDDDVCALLARAEPPRAPRR